MKIYIIFGGLSPPNRTTHIFLAELADAIYFLKFWFNPSNEAMTIKNFMECGFSDYCRSYNGLFGILSGEMIQLGIKKVRDLLSLDTCVFIFNLVDSFISELDIFFYILVGLFYMI